MDNDIGGGRFRQLLVMVGDDQLKAEFACDDCFLDTRDPAIDRDHQVNTFILQTMKCLAVQAITFFKPIGYVIARVVPAIRKTSSRIDEPHMPSTS